MSLMWVSLALVLSGILILVASLIPTRRIYRDHAQQPQVMGWYSLFVLIGLFITGYTAYALSLLKQSVSMMEFVLALLLFGGSCFVVLVTRLSLLSIHEVKRIAALERHHALHDELTNLPNRTLLYERLKHVLGYAQQKQRPMVVMIMDLNQFKEVNDTLGHHSGDRLLQQVAPRLKQALRESDTVARLGGDEFAIVLPDTDTTGALPVCSKIVNAMEKPFAIEGHSLKVTASIGIACFPADGDDADSLLQKADVAMYVAKKDNSGFAVYDPERDLHSLNRLMMIGQLHEAIKNNDLVLHYQPIVKLKTNQVWGCEALVRWQHPELGLLDPSEFIPIAEQSGMVKDLTRWVIDSAMHQFKTVTYHDAALCLSINLSVKDIQDAGFVDKLKLLLLKHGMSEKQLRLEITESSMMTDSRRAHEVIGQLHALGVELAIDDFGTGFSSLSYLKQLPAKSIKIDKTFVYDMIEDENDAVIVRSTIDLAHNMGRHVVAEGVENRDTLEILEILGCDYIQGNYISKPMDMDDLNEWIMKRYGIRAEEVRYVTA
ncbi:MAG: EAL domain-containing protein [Gammaproteobacteria bacterium]|nr:EAL domain-containing protein [Gammaproteobacteria bacterium]MDH5653341.1 EAL domain-containing protein [Gammaproteobacteria bacterium]